VNRRVALVTGANQGIGLEVCRQLAAQGLRVVLTGRTAQNTKAAAAELQAEGLDVIGAVMDVADTGSIQACARHLTLQVGQVDVVVNNAAVLIAENEELLDTSIDVFTKTFETNAWGPLRVCQTFVPSMIKRQYGRIVNVSSAAGQLSSMRTYAPAYSISKAALNALTIQLSAAVGGTGVLVNCVNPGWVRTRMGGSRAPRSLVQGAETIVWAATLPPNGPTGQFFSDRRPIDW
jgi:NAD(P)-dependent dehydrogenase (short-subunit alcohol dehydrogenase family)